MIGNDKISISMNNSLSFKLYASTDPDILLMSHGMFLPTLIMRNALRKITVDKNEKGKILNTFEIQDTISNRFITLWIVQSKNVSPKLSD